jgi:hypothetical protein
MVMGPHSAFPDLATSKIGPVPFNAFRIFEWIQIFRKNV